MTEPAGIALKIQLFKICFRYVVRMFQALTQVVKYIPLQFAG